VSGQAKERQGERKCEINEKDCFFRKIAITWCYILKIFVTGTQIERGRQTRKLKLNFFLKIDSKIHIKHVLI
jgi:hypothetical protein